MPWDTTAEYLHTEGDYPGRASDMLRTARQPRIEFRSSPGCPEPGLSHMKLPTRSLRGWWLGSRPVVVGARRWEIPCSAAWPRASAAPPACRPRPCPGLHLRLPDGLVFGVMPLGKAPPTCAPWFRKPATAEMPSGGRRHIRASPPRSAEPSYQDRGIPVRLHGCRSPDRWRGRAAPRTRATVPRIRARNPRHPIRFVELDRDTRGVPWAGCREINILRQPPVPAIVCST